MHDFLSSYFVLMSYDNKKTLLLPLIYANSVFIGRKNSFVWLDSEVYRAASNHRILQGLGLRAVLNRNKRPDCLHRKQLVLLANESWSRRTMMTDDASSGSSLGI